MRKMYEIQQELEQLLENAIDPETGELILDDNRLAELEMERDAKIEGVALWAKEEDALASALAEQIKELTRRKKATEGRRDRAKTWLVMNVEGKKFETPRAVLKFTDSEKTVTDAEFIEWAEKEKRFDLLRTVPEKHEPDAKAIKAAINAGEKFDYARIMPNRSVSIK